MGSGHKKKRNTAAAERRRILENLFYFITYPLLTYNIFIPSIDSGIKKCLRHFMKNLRFFFNLRPSGEGLSYKVKKNPALQDSPLAAGRGSDMLPTPPQCDNCFLADGTAGQTF